MGKRSLKLGMLILLCIGATVGAFLILPVQHGVTKANLDRIEIGMTAQEVESIFGKPASDKIPLPFVGLAAPGEVLIWQNGDGSQASVYCRFDSGEVFRKDWRDSTETIAEKIHRLVRWPWW